MFWTPPGKGSMDNDNYITKCECDSCGAKTLCVLFHCHGTPVLAECRACNPITFESLARQEIAAWLEGRYFHNLALDFINGRVEGSATDRKAA